MFTAPCAAEVVRCYVNAKTYPSTSGASTVTFSKANIGATDIVYRDNVTGQKKLHTFEQPEVLWWYVKDGTPIDDSTEPTEFVKADKFVFYRPLDELITIKTKFTDLVKDIAVRTNNLSYFYDNLKSGTYYNNKKLFTHPRVFGCDAPITIRFLFFAKLISTSMSKTQLQARCQHD
jgi:hypothetical protein